MNKKNNNKFEKDLKRLEEISELLEDNSVDLDDALNLYEEGIELSRTCISALKKAELRITELKKKLDELNLEDEE
ncbi:MAG TPA: exodeoxyribonuclease VII small subunit [Ignavibacteriaceae bacterium]|nr:exodeoxyribonuclease VII small subunit [Ignavibacteriaceae bacterium]